MSYDVSLGYGCCGSHDENITSNLRAMFAEAGICWPDLGGKRAQHVGSLCLRAVTEMLRDPDRFKAHNPPNGWGDYDGAIEFLIRIAQHCLAHPDATMEVSW